MRKAQIFSGEFVVAYLIYMIALIFIIHLWNSTEAGIFDTEGYYLMESTAIQFSESLVRTPGFPIDWEITTVGSLGLVNESRILQGKKIIGLMHLLNETNYEEYSHISGVGEYDLFVNITYLNGSTLIINNTQASTGRSPVNDTQKITIYRTAIFSDQIVRVIVTVWKS